MHNTRDTYSALHVLYTFTKGQFYILPSLETCEGLKAFYGERFYYNTYTGMCLTSDLQVDPTRTIRIYRKLFSVIDMTY